MNVLHLFPKDNALIAKHVSMLDRGSQAAEHPDIVHVHGCWQYALVSAALKARRQGARIVLTPHGELEPWVINDRRMSGKPSTTLRWQRRLVEHSYVVIAQGNMEAEALSQLGWNPRIEVVRNAVVTNSITPEAMLRHTQEVYRKVMDSNTLELMSDESKHLLQLLLKAGITGDRRWVTELAPDISEQQWRYLLVYADQENVRTTVDQGARLLGISHPYIETDKIKSYLPTDYSKPKPEAHDAASLVSELHRRQPTLRHLVELDRSLRKNNIQEDRLVDVLDENRLLKYFRRLLCILSEQTGLDEGFMPARPIDDRLTQAIRKRLQNHLRI